MQISKILTSSTRVNDDKMRTHRKNQKVDENFEFAHAQQWISQVIASKVRKKREIIN